MKNNAIHNLVSEITFVKSTNKDLVITTKSFQARILISKKFQSSTLKSFKLLRKRWRVSPMPVVLKDSCQGSTGKGELKEV